MSAVMKTEHEHQGIGRFTSLGQIRRELFAPIDIGMVVLFRVAFGGSMLIEVIRYLLPLPGGLTKIQVNYIDPPVHFTYYGFSWVHPLPGIGMYILFCVLGVAALLMTIGLLYRLAAATFFLGFSYVFLLDQTLYLNHFYLICLLSGISVIVPANRAWSIDALLQPSIHSWTVPAWTLWLLRFQIGVAYFYGGIAKMNGDWLSGVPMYLMMSSRTDFPVIGQFFHEPWLIYVYAYGGLLFDLLIVPLLLWNRTRMAAYVAAVLFHTSNAKMFNIGIFPVVMVAVTIIFFPPETMRSKQRKDDPAVALRRPPRFAWWQKLLAGIVVLHVVAQLLIPLRHFLYPGDVNWTEEGHRFSWHMKLRSKSSQAAFLVVDGSGEPMDWQSPELALTPRQTRVMASRPDMVLQYAHLIRDRLEAEGHREVHVYVYDTSSLDGRAPQPLVDPKVDLAGQPRNLWPAHWIVPLYQPLPSLSEIQARLQSAPEADSFE